MSVTRERLIQAATAAIHAETDGMVAEEGWEVRALARAAVDAVLLASVDEVVGQYIVEITSALAERSEQ